MDGCDCEKAMRSDKLFKHYEIFVIFDGEGLTVKSNTQEYKNASQTKKKHSLL